MVVAGHNILGGGPTAETTPDTKMIARTSYDKRYTSAIFPILLALVLSCWFIEPSKGATIVEVLQAEQYTVLYDFINRFPTLLSLLSNLTINSTIFAPSNAAFNQITPPTGNALLQALTYHLTAGAVPTAVLTDQELLPSLLTTAGLGNQAQVLKITIQNASGTHLQQNLLRKKNK